MDAQEVTCFVMLDSDVTIDCLFESVPEGVGEIADLGSLNVSNVQVDDTSISIEGVMNENLGAYQCRASNTVAGEVVAATINIRVMEGGIISKLLIYRRASILSQVYNVYDRGIAGPYGRGGFFFTKGVLPSIKWVWLT
jgi:hypothetical protein